jgi:hypothetical protein
MIEAAPASAPAIDPQAVSGKAISAIDRAIANVGLSAEVAKRAEGAAQPQGRALAELKLFGIADAAKPQPHLALEGTGAKQTAPRQAAPSV